MMNTQPHSIQTFIQFLCQQWKLKRIPTLPLNCEICPVFAAQTAWSTVLVFDATSTDRHAWIRILQQIPDCIVFHFDEQMDLVDIYAQSMMDISPIIISKLSWKNHETFWALGKCQDYTTFCLELSSRFGKLHLERRFVADFKKFTQKLAKSWTFLSDDSESTRYQLALHTLLRILFITFLASKGMLDHRPQFLQEEAQKCEYAHRSIYRDLIQPLFFETLNRAYGHRTQKVQKFGQIPFLNGGLFTPSVLEQTSPSLNAPNDIWLDIIENLFQRYTFDIHAHPENKTLSLDPLMLGHVFESLMSKDQRAATGTFYTPIPIAQKLVQSTFKAFLKQNFPTEDIHAILNHEFHRFSHERLLSLEQKLSQVTLLDPASGSGTFLQCAFDWLHQMRSALHQYLQIPMTAGELARQILSRNLYGIDIVPTANLLCELRLWLELIRHYPSECMIPPLPNLDLNIVCGNTLTDLSHYTADLPQIPHIPHSNKLTHLKCKYRLSSGKTKKLLLKQIALETQNYSKQILNALIVACQQECETIENSSIDLFTHKPSPNRAQRTRISVLQNQIQQIHKIIQTHGMLPGFSFDLQFGDIIENGGFDIILGNPPWFPLHTLPMDMRQHLKQLYYTAQTSHGGTKSQSADISALFVEKSIRCTKIGGFIAMLIPNKLFYARSYASFRHHIQSTTRLIEKIDWSHAKHNTFQATAYPATLILEKTQIPIPVDSPPHALESILELPSPFPHPIFATPLPTMMEKFEIKRGICTGANPHYLGNQLAPIDAQVSLFAPNHTELCQSFLKGGSPLRRYAANVCSNILAAYAPTPHAGLCPATPRTPNTQQTPPDLYIPIESELIHPILKGANIKAYHAESQHDMIFTHRWTHPQIPLAELPPCAQSWFEHCHLQMPPKNRKKTPHAVLGACQALNRPKVVWKDISKDLEACFIPDNHIIPINTVYYIPICDEDTAYLITAWLNSRWARAFCRNTAVHARGDYRRYFSWVVGKLPWPFEPINTNQTQQIQSIITLAKRAHQVPEAESHDLQNQIDSFIEIYLDQFISQMTSQPQPIQQPCKTQNIQTKIASY